ncbi:hypothetical protein Tco_0190098 [Tanacetum coccineum]
MVVYLEKTEGNSNFYEIVDFLTSNLIHHALTVSPPIYTSYSEQFWNTTSSQTANDVKQINATVDSKGSGHTSDRSEGTLNLQELSILCTNLSNKVLALESIKDAQAAEISALKSRIKKLEKKSTSQASQIIGKMVKRDCIHEKRFLKEGMLIILWRTMKLRKAVERGGKVVERGDVDDSSRPARSILTLKPLPTIDPKDKGKGVLKESPVKKVKRSDLDAAQIAKDAEIARLIHEKELAKIEKEKKERQRTRDPATND